MPVTIFVILLWRFEDSTITTSKVAVIILFIYLFICWCFICSCLGIQITITQGPNNITAYVGESVTLQCHYTGTDNQPKWRIGGVTYTSTNLPAGYRLTREGLHIPSVWAELNNTLYVCFFTAFVAQKGTFENIESNPAIVIVRIRCK